MWSLVFDALFKLALVIIKMSFHFSPLLWLSSPWRYVLYIANMEVSYSFLLFPGNWPLLRKLDSHWYLCWINLVFIFVKRT